MSRNQADYKKVYEAIIEPLMRHYGAEYDEKIIDDYIRIFAKHSREKLEAAVGEVIEEQKRKPTIAHITDKIRRDEKRGGGDSAWLQNFYAEQEAKQVRARAAAENYAEWEIRHLEPQLARLAPHRAQYVKEFVYHAAVYQAEGLEGIKNRGFNSICLGLPGEVTSERREWFFKMCKDAGSVIKVVVPFKWFEPKLIKAEPKKEEEIA